MFENKSLMHCLLHCDQSDRSDSRILWRARISALRAQSFSDDYILGKQEQMYFDLLSQWADFMNYQVILVNRNKCISIRCHSWLISKLQSVQNAAARLIRMTHKYDHITPVLKDLHWLPVKERVNFKILLLTYKALNDLTPSYIKDLLKSYTPTRCLRSKSQNLLTIHKYELESFGRRAFSIAAPILWNSIPDHRQPRLCMRILNIQCWCSWRRFEYL